MWSRVRDCLTTFLEGKVQGNGVFVGKQKNQVKINVNISSDQRPCYVINHITYTIKCFFVPGRCIIYVFVHARENFVLPLSLVIQSR